MPCRASASACSTWTAARPCAEPVDRLTFEAIVSLCAIAIERTRLAEANLRNQVLGTVGQVASAIVHDFKNGLFVIAGHAQLLGLTSADAGIQHHLAQILGAAERLGQLSMDILEYSKVREPKLETVDLRALHGGPGGAPAAARPGIRGDPGMPGPALPAPAWTGTGSTG